MGYYFPKGSEGSLNQKVYQMYQKVYQSGIGISIHLIFANLISLITMSLKCLYRIVFILSLFICALGAHGQIAAIRTQFRHPSAQYKPGVYWYFMDGNMSAGSIKKDLEAMKAAGIGNAIFLEVNVGVPRGNVDFLSDQWFSLFVYAMKEAKRLGINISLGIGPGWTGSGGPWVKASQSMQLLVASETVVSPDNKGEVSLPVPAPPKPFFGEGGLPDEFKKARSDYYEDVAVLAFPAPAKDTRLTDYEEKALFYRAPYSSTIVRPSISSSFPEEGADPAIPSAQVIDLTNKMDHDGKLNWHPQKGKWVVMRFVSRNNGAITRPAPVPGLGFESDEFDTIALKVQLDAYAGKILKHVGNAGKGPGGLKTLHMDSWEMSSQNWTQQFMQEFIKRHGYDPLKYFPAYYGHVVGSAEKSERFLWDMRQTTQELIFENHAGYVKKYARQHGLNLSIEPYDMNPTSDLDLGSVADVPMAEFWSKGYGFNTSFSVVEATSIGHIEGKSLIQSEAFTAQGNEGWRQHPASMKNQGDWALAAGITKFYFHTFENQFLPDSLRPGATMGPYGVHWDRNQTWWPMAGAYHAYLSRCQYLLQQGRTVADILYLTPEGCPNVFLPPSSALTRDTIGDRKGFNFDGCTGKQLMKATVTGHKIRFPGGATYKILVLPSVKTMTPKLLTKIETLVKAGAVIVGPRPLTSPSLVNYPACDELMNKIGKRMWGETVPAGLNYHPYGKGTVINGGAVDDLDGSLYPYYQTVSSILKKLNYTEDFMADGPVRYTHRTSQNWDIYFVSNTSANNINFKARFRTVVGAPELWDAVTGNVAPLYHFTHSASTTSIPLQLHAYESCFVVFSKDFGWKAIPGGRAIIKTDTICNLSEDWDVAFNPKWGGPSHTEFKKLADWSQMADEGIKYYSGIATYTKTFAFNQSIPQQKDGHVYLNLGDVKNMARVTLNGKETGIVWTAPWRIDITSALQKGNNVLKIEVANLWANRLIGDEKLSYDGPQDGKWPGWLLNGQPRPGKRYTFTTSIQYNANSPLQPSGLIGPVSVAEERIIHP